MLRFNQLQSAFLEGKQSSDNVFFVTVSVHDLNISRAHKFTTLGDYLPEGPLSLGDNANIAAAFLKLFGQPPFVENDGRHLEFRPF
jgi:hypothetical protein